MTEDEQQVRWVVWRQDDKGQQFVMMTTYGTREEAEAAAAELEARGHKQHYWVEREDHRDE